MQRAVTTFQQALKLDPQYYDLDGHLDLFVANYVNFDPNLAPAPGASALCKYCGVPVACGPQGMGDGTNIL